MNDKDKAAFEAWYATRRVIRSVIQPGEEWQAALAHRDAQVAGLVEALKHIGATGYSNIDRNIAREALAAWEANK